MTVVSRVGVRAKPAKNHPEYKEWETANVVVLVAADSRDETLDFAREVLRKERWELLEVQLCDRLIEERVREQGGAMLEAYESAVAIGSAIRVLLNRDDLKGGIIYLNTGYGSFAPEEFGPLVERYVRKDTTQIEALFCVALWNQTNGFDSYVFYRAYPEKTSIAVISQLQEAFGKRFEEAMTQLVLGTLPTTAVFSDPLTPITFSVDGIDYVWQPGLVPLKLNDGPQ